MIRGISELDDEQEMRTMDAQGLAAVGEMPARDREFEALLRRAANFQKIDNGCKLRGEAR